MKKALLFLKIVQVVSNEERHKNGLKRLGKGYFKAYRLNPYHPIGYVLVAVCVPIFLLMYGFVGTVEMIKDGGNPFVWN
jgi:hypothetical protein